MAILRDDPVQFIAQEQVRLFAELKKLPETAWRQASSCEGWTNATVVAHLTRASEFYGQSVSKASRGDCLPPSIPGGQRLTVEQFRERSRKRQAELTELPRNELLAEFDKQGTALVDVLRRIPAQSMTKLAWHPSGQWTIARYVSMRVFELAYHGWDIHVSLDRKAVIRPQLQSFLVHLQLQMGKRSFEENEDLDGIYRFELQGSQAWTTRIFNGKIEYGPIEPSPDAIIRTDANHFLLLATRRESASLLQQGGLLQIEGDRERADQLLEAIGRGY